MPRKSAIHPRLWAWKSLLNPNPPSAFGVPFTMIMIQVQTWWSALSHLQIKPGSFNAEWQGTEISLAAASFFQHYYYSEDGFYATWIKAPLEGGQWSVEAVSLSPFHGLRMAQPQPLLRTKPIHVQIDGIPALVRRGEILTNLTLRTRNNMPIPLKVLYTLHTRIKSPFLGRKISYFLGIRTYNTFLV